MAFGAYGGNCNEGGVLNNQGSNGNYWSSTGQSAANAYRAYFNTSGNVNTGVDGNNKYNARTVRCIEGCLIRVGAFGDHGLRRSGCWRLW